MEVFFNYPSVNIAHPLMWFCVLKTFIPRSICNQSSIDKSYEIAENYQGEFETDISILLDYLVGFICDQS